MKAHTKILSGLILGALCGLAANTFAPGAASVRWLANNIAAPAGKIFLHMLLMTVLPLVFASITLGVASLGDIRKVGRVGVRTLVYFVLSTTLATMIGLILVNLVRPGEGISPTVREHLMEAYRSQAVGMQAAGANRSVVDTIVGSAANVSSARASLEEAEAKAARSKALAEKGLLSTQELDSVLAAEKKAKAAVATSQAQQAVSAASLEAARANLEKATIRSPVDGVVLSRSVEPGQTVASSLQAPVLFVVEQDLTTMKLKVNVDEADVGSVREGQDASFTVDAYPKKRFPSAVEFIKNVPTAGKDVVTYEAELSVSNTERLLRPGMTATATIVTEEKTDALLVPNAALRFTPPNALPTASQRSTGLALPGLGKPPGMGRSPSGSKPGARKAEGARVWVLQTRPADHRAEDRASAKT